MHTPYWVSRHSHPESDWLHIQHRQQYPQRVSRFPGSMGRGGCQCCWFAHYCHAVGRHSEEQPKPGHGLGLDQRHPHGHQHRPFYRYHGPGSDRRRSGRPHLLRSLYLLHRRCLFVRDGGSPRRREHGLRRPGGREDEGNSTCTISVILDVEEMGAQRCSCLLLMSASALEIRFFFLILVIIIVMYVELRMYGTMTFLIFWL